MGDVYQLDEAAAAAPLVPPRPLPPGPVPTPGPNLFDGGSGTPCELCEDPACPFPIPGIYWRPYDSPLSMPLPDEIGPPIRQVTSCDGCGRYATDADAARVVADRYGLEAVFLEDRPWDIDEEDRGKGCGCHGVRERVDTTARADAIVAAGDVSLLRDYHSDKRG